MASTRIVRAEPAAILPDVKHQALDRRSDAELVAVCNQSTGDEAAAAFDSLYRRHKEFVLRVALRLTEDREIAADALQEVFTYLLKQFPPPGNGLRLSARLTTYLYPIAKNCTISLLRKARRIEATDIEPDELAAASEPVEGTDDLDRLLGSLAPERQEILSLRFVDGLSLEEIATALGIPLGTVKSRLHLAIKALREDPAAKKFFQA